MKKAHAIGIGVILVFGAFGATAFKDAATPYVSFDEARAAASTVQVKGRLDTGSIRVDSTTHRLCFDLLDSQTGRLPVVYSGAEPGNFRQASEVVVVGRYTEGAFAAEKVLVKCPSKYQSQGTSHPQGVPMAPSKQ
ncbi:MAG: cytochrome c maturation protein CcmE [Armatimonadota bacterium]|nr:cytochrome c maturation protein CcmE [Armatimonadota bacterium]